MHGQVDGQVDKARSPHSNRAATVNNAG